ncbi:MAG: heme-copper oxidase subunit III [Gemmatimonadetes bacterium]|nr:heme-copper oxidase subunit III [Gemmatimonadota bacterium]
MAHAAAVNRPPERGLDVYTQKVGMWVFLCSEVMFFAGLIGSYIVLRFGALENTWPEPAEVLAVNITAFNTFLLICSSVTMVKAFAAAQAHDDQGIKKWLLATTLIGAGFLGVQVYEYNELINHHFTPSNCVVVRNGVEETCSILYGSTFYTMTGFHGFHVLLGVICLGWATIRAYRGHWSGGNSRGIEILGLYWHFVDLVWIILFTIVYLI